MRHLFLSSILLTTSIVFAQWRNTNPGAGGQIQHLTCHPTIEGRMYFASDVEGYYQSDDFGNTWHFMAKSTKSQFTFIIQAEPNNPNRIYAGFQFGFALSDDNGMSWKNITLPSASPNMSVAQIAVDPNNVNNIYVANSWLEDNPPSSTFTKEFGEEEPATLVDKAVVGSRKIWYSKNRGQTWAYSYYFPKNTVGDRNIYSISIHPKIDKQIVIANDSGLVHSIDGGIKWKLLPPPKANLYCQGGDYTPDGKWLYAIYNERQNDKVRSNLYALNTNTSKWHLIHEELDNPLEQCKVGVWQPKIYGKSTSDKHFIMFGGLERPGPAGLYEAEIDIKNDIPHGKIRSAFHYLSRGDVKFDIGWNAYQNYSRTYSYYPAAWKNTEGKQRGALVMAQQSFFTGDLHSNQWLVKSSKRIKSVAINAKDSIGMYTNTGTASTVNFDSDGYKNYMVQAQADNALVESYDNGNSWYQNNPPLLSIQGNCDAVAVLPLPTPIVLASTQNGYGGAQNYGTGVLRYKELKNLEKPTDIWQTLINTGTPNGKDASRLRLLGLTEANSRITYINYDPNNPKRVYITCAAGSKAEAPHKMEMGNVYVCNDIVSLIANPSNENFWFKNIGGNGGPENKNCRKIVIDPNDSNIIYVRAIDGTYKGTKIKDQFYWQKVKINDSTQGLGGSYQTTDDIAIWNNGGKSIFAITQRIADQDALLWLSYDGTKSFQKVLDKDISFKLKGPEGNWYDKTHPVLLTGLAGFDNNLFVATYVRRPPTKGGPQKGINILKGTIDKKGKITWQNWTGDHNLGEIEYPTVRSAKIRFDQNNKPYLIVATHGSGSWTRYLD
jgi:hypothetical protein